MKQLLLILVMLVVGSQVAFGDELKLKYPHLTVSKVMRIQAELDRKRAEEKTVPMAPAYWSQQRSTSPAVMDCVPVDNGMGGMLCTQMQ